MFKGGQICLLCGIMHFWIAVWYFAVFKCISYVQYVLLCHVVTVMMYAASVNFCNKSYLSAQDNTKLSYCRGTVRHIVTWNLINCVAISIHNSIKGLQTICCSKEQLGPIPTCNDWQSPIKTELSESVIQPCSVATVSKQNWDTMESLHGKVHSAAVTMASSITRLSHAP